MRFVYLLAFLALLYILVISFGYFISILFYRLNKFGKIAIGAGVPIALIFILSVLAFLETEYNLNIFISIGKFILFSFGVNPNNPNPYAAMITLATISVITNLFSWLLLQKADAKVKANS